MEQMNTRFLPGDTVTVLSYDDISTKFDDEIAHILPSGCIFRDEMKQYCECDYIVERVMRQSDERIGFYKLYGVGWYFTDEMLMAQEHHNSTENSIIVMSFDEVMNFSK